MKKLVLMLLAVCLLMVFTAGSALGATSSYPNDVIRIVVTFGAGGGNDLIARAVASGLEEVVGQTVIVENILGAGGMTGSYEVVSAKPDGYKVLIQDSSLTSMFVTQNKEVPFTLDDLVPVASVFSCPTWGVSSSEKGYQNLQDFIDDAKANPGQRMIGTAVTTGAQYLMAAAIVDYFDLDAIIIPYEGGNELKAAVLGGHVDIGIVHSPILLPEAKEGIVNVLVAGDELDRLNEEQFHDVKTLNDYGMEMKFSSTRGFLLPKGTPDEIVTFLEGALEKALQTEMVKKFSNTFGYEPEFHNHIEYSEFLQKELHGYFEVFNNLSN